MNANFVSLDSDLSFFDSKIESKKFFIESLKKASEEKVDPSEWYESVIWNFADMLDLFTSCKNKLQMKEDQSKLGIKGGGTHSSTNKLTPQNSPIPAVPTPSNFASPASFQQFTFPLASTSSPPASIDEPTLALRIAENQKSITLMNLSESSAFDPAQKRQSDLDNVVEILNCVCVSAQVVSITRFSPNFLTLKPDRPPFVKVRFASEEEKKKVLIAVKANLPRVRSLAPKFAEVAIGDPDKSGKAVNNCKLVKYFYYFHILYLFLDPTNPYTFKSTIGDPEKLGKAVKNCKFIYFYCFHIFILILKTVTLLHQHLDQQLMILISSQRQLMTVSLLYIFVAYLHVLMLI